ncbi:MAG: DUF2799 domain-containing protein [Hyphomicrobiales bacterium]
MIKLTAFLGFFVGLLALSACATLNEDECKTVDWKQLGDIDGSQGHSSSRIAQHSKACEKHGLPVNVAAYNQGWKVAIARYCTAQNGFNLGKRGATYRGSCPSEFAATFESAYRPTKNLHDAVKRLQSAEQAIEQDIDEISRLSHSKDPKKLKKLKYVSERLKTNQGDIHRLRANVASARRRVQDYLRENPDIRAS